MAQSGAVIREKEPKGNGGILCLKGSNVFGRHTNNETTNRFGRGNTAKAQKVETSIELKYQQSRYQANAETIGNATFECRNGNQYWIEPKGYNKPL